MKRLPGIFRDVHPDREPVDFGRGGGRRRVYDIDSRLMDHCRRVAGIRGENFKRVLRRIIRAGLDAMERKGGTL